MTIAMLTMDGTTAEALRVGTAAMACRLDPRPMADGDHALPPRVRDDPVFAAWTAVLAALPLREIDPATAWPSGED